MFNLQVNIILQYKPLCTTVVNRHKKNALHVVFNFMFIRKKNLEKSMISLVVSLTENSTIVTGTIYLGSLFKVFHKLTTIQGCQYCQLCLAVPLGFKICLQYPIQRFTFTLHSHLFSDNS